ncbi:unnamed protein product [Cuscuta campestris]|uniref:DUF1985 domain-containing protein n=1 Tax=Cuscuta campestris TaxID=132261 RepID=A0A484LBT1_9ASTE|nr:unnamed protein product [Cuscuta campestris]
MLFVLHCISSSDTFKNYHTSVCHGEHQRKLRISAEVTPSVEGESFPDASEIEELTFAKNDFIQAHFPFAKKGKKSVAVTYKMVVQHFLDICKGLDGETKNEGHKMDDVKKATLLFVVVVLLGPADRDKSAIPDWVMGMISKRTVVLDFPCGTWAFIEFFWSRRKDLAAKGKSIGSGASSTMYYTGFLLSIGALQSILVPDKFEATAEWYLNIHPLETTADPELDAFVAKLEGRAEVHIPVERKRKARNVLSPTRDNSVERNKHISSPQAYQSLRESPSRVSHSNIPTPSSPTPHPTKPLSNSFQELFDRMSQKIDDIAEEQRKRFEVLEKKVDALSTLINQKTVNKVPAMTIMDNCEETKARNPSPDDKVSPRLGILQILGEINQEHENPPSTLCDYVLSLENIMLESTHDTMIRDGAASIEPLELLVEKIAQSTHETMGTEAAASMKPLQDMVVSPQKELGNEAEIIDAHVHRKHLSEYLYVLRRRLCNDNGDSVIAHFEFTTYVNSFAHDPEYHVLSRSIEKIVDGTYSERQEAFKTKA